jgi:hypothetical protein
MIKHSREPSVAVSDKIVIPNGAVPPSFESLRFVAATLPAMARHLY